MTSTSSHNIFRLNSGLVLSIQEEIELSDCLAHVESEESETKDEDNSYYQSQHSTIYDYFRQPPTNHSCFIFQFTSNYIASLINRTLHNRHFMPIYYETPQMTMGLILQYAHLFILELSILVTIIKLDKLRFKFSEGQFEEYCFTFYDDKQHLYQIATKKMFSYGCLNTKNKQDIQAFKELVVYLQDIYQLHFSHCKWFAEELMPYWNDFIFTSFDAYLRQGFADLILRVLLILHPFEKRNFIAVDGTFNTNCMTSKILHAMLNRTMLILCARYWHHSEQFFHLFLQFLNVKQKQKFYIVKDGLLLSFLSEFYLTVACPIANPIIHGVMYKRQIIYDLLAIEKTADVQISNGETIPTLDDQYSIVLNIICILCTSMDNASMRFEKEHLYRAIYAKERKSKQKCMSNKKYNDPYNIIDDIVPAPKSSTLLSAKILPLGDRDRQLFPVTDGVFYRRLLSHIKRNKCESGIQILCHCMYRNMTLSQVIIEKSFCWSKLNILHIPFIEQIINIDDSFTKQRIECIMSNTAAYAVTMIEKISCSVHMDIGIAYIQLFLGDILSINDIENGCKVGLIEKNAKFCDWMFIPSIRKQWEDSWADYLVQYCLKSKGNYEWQMCMRTYGNVVKRAQNKLKKYSRYKIHNKNVR